MYPRRSISWLAPFVVCLATTAGAWDEGEHFIATYVPDPEVWELVPDPSRPAAQLWKNRTNERDQYRIEPLVGSREAVAEARMTLDGPGKANCPSFDTTTIRQSPVNGYPSLLWRTDCARPDGSKSTLLNLAVRGRDSLYLAMKIWQFDVTDSEVDTWIERFERYFVCDTRKADQPCPTGIERVD